MRQRGDRGRADCVAEEKFCMIFRSDITLHFPTNTECTVTAQVNLQDSKYVIATCLFIYLFIFHHCC